MIFRTQAAFRISNIDSAAFIGRYGTAKGKYKFRIDSIIALQKGKISKSFALLEEGWNKQKTGKPKKSRSPVLMYLGKIISLNENSYLHYVLFFMSITQLEYPSSFGTKTKVLGIVKNEFHHRLFQILW